MTKKGRQMFQEKVGWYPSVAAPGDTNRSDVTASPSDATGQMHISGWGITVNL